MLRFVVSIVVVISRMVVSHVSHGAEATSIVVVEVLVGRSVVLSCQSCGSFERPVNSTGHDVCVTARKHNVGSTGDGVFPGGAFALLHEELPEARHR